ncbi:MAG: ABC transporter substrate-binding protein [Bacteroidia bacterium]|nr:ABC transporter substrate-binding protein [Bacteroidia bacterium]
MKSFFRGIMALILVSAILLFSDLQNRSRKTNTQNINDQARSEALTGRKFKLAMVNYVDSHNSEDCDKGIRKALEDKKLIEGVDFTFKVYNAQGDMSTLNSILPQSRIVFTNVGDPIAAGLGKSFDDHLPNLCGISTMSDFEGLIKLVHQLHPRMKRAGTVFAPAEINSVSYKDRLAAAAKKDGIELIAAPAGNATDVLDAANSLVAQRIDVFCQISDNLTGSCSAAILKVSLDSKVPYYGFVSQQMKQGAVAVGARDYFQAGYEAGQMGIEVLSGKDPAKIPYRFVEKTDYLITLETAKIFKIRVPDQIFTAFPQLKIIKP